MTADFLILGILTSMHQAVFPSPVVIFTLLAILTNICHLWTVATPWERYTFTSICHLSESQSRPQMSHKSNVSPVSVAPPCRDSLLCSHYMILLDKQTSDVCRKSVPSAMPPGQVHESWYHDHNAQAHLWKTYSITSIEQTIQ